MTDNPFAPPSGDRPAGTEPGGQGPAYWRPSDASPYDPPPEEEKDSGHAFLPDTLWGACHLAAAGAWGSALVWMLVRAAITGDVDGVGPLLLLTYAVLLLILLMVGFLAMTGGLLTAVTLLWKGRGGPRERGERLAEAGAVTYLGVAWLFAGWFVFGIFG